MKKNQEGYVLVYVLVVIVVLSALSIGIFSHTLRNLKGQEAAVAYEQEKYEAEGLIVQAVETLRNKGNLDSLTSDKFSYSLSTETGVYMLTAKSQAENVQVIAAITINSSDEVTYISYTVSSTVSEDGGGS